MTDSPSEEDYIKVRFIEMFKVAENGLQHFTNHVSTNVFVKWQMLFPFQVVAICMTFLITRHLAVV